MYSKFCLMLSNKSYGDHSWVRCSVIWERVCFRLCVSRERVQHLWWGPRGFFEVGPIAFLWEVPTDSMVLSKARGENRLPDGLGNWRVAVLHQQRLVGGRRWLCSFPVHHFCQPWNSWSSSLPLNVGNCSGSLLGQSVPPLCMVIAKQLRMSGSQ